MQPVQKMFQIYGEFKVRSTLAFGCVCPRGLETMNTDSLTMTISEVAKVLGRSRFDEVFAATPEKELVRNLG